MYSRILEFSFEIFTIAKFIFFNKQLLIFHTLFLCLLSIPITSVDLLFHKISLPKREVRFNLPNFFNPFAFVFYISSCIHVDTSAYLYTECACCVCSEHTTDK